MFACTRLCAYVSVYMFENKCICEDICVCVRMLTYVSVCMCNICA